MRILTPRTSLAIVLSLLALGCGPPPEPADTESGESAIALGTLTTLAPWIVRIDLPGNKWCSASVLTEHWLLTAAHCVDGRPQPFNMQVRWAQTPGGDELVYDGPVRTHVHPHYRGSGPFSKHVNDIALIRLHHVTGIDLARTGRAKLWNHRNPRWASHDPIDRQFSAIGWGRGDNCREGTQGRKRFRHPVHLARTSIDARTVSTVNNHQPFCSVDSGTPWLFTDHNGDFVAFAVHSVSQPDLVVAGDNNKAPLIEAHGQWMFETARNEGVLDLICGGECVERRPPATPPPPPGTICSGGGTCCEPNPSGPVCLKCVAPHQQCQ